jgi:uracil-DNA glycosylase
MSTLKRKGDALADGDTKKPKANASISSFFAPAAKAAPKPAVSPTFDKKKWVESLTAEQKELLTLEIETLDDSWLAYLKDDIVTKEFMDLKRYLNKETAAGRKWFPPKEDVYSW